MSRMRTVLLVGLVVVTGQFGCEDDLCGNGVVDPGERCDDGNTTWGDGCSTACVIEEGWNCIDTLCAPACGDGLVVESIEPCDPSVGEWTGYCADDCSAVTGRCGDLLVQPEQEVCDGHRGCDDDCTPGFGFVCGGEPLACTATGLPPDRPMRELTQDEVAVICSWLNALLGGPGATFTCGDWVYEVLTVESCVRQTDLAAFGNCTVGEIEEFVLWADGNRCYLARINPDCV